MKHGIVTSSKTSKDGHQVLTVQSSRGGVTLKPVKVQVNHPGQSQSIEEGWHVTVQECDDGLLVCSGVLNTNPDFVPAELNASERVMKFDDGTEISVRQDGSGGYNLDINASGNVTVNATGDVTIGKAENAVKLAVQNHTHDYTWSDSSGSGTTDAPNEPGTETAVE